jgi:hypothetical protein
MPTANVNSASRKGFGKPGIDIVGRIRTSTARRGSAPVGRLVAPIQAKR